MIFEVDQEKLLHFLKYSTLAFLIPKFERWWPQSYLEAIEYRLEQGTLHVSQGVFFRYRKAIPVKRITDVVLYQGPILRRYFGIWFLRIHTAGSGYAWPEASLMGLFDPEGVRDAILAAARAESNYQHVIEPEAEDGVG